MARKLSYSFPSLEVAGLSALEPPIREAFRALSRNLQQFLITVGKAVNENSTPLTGTTANRPTTDLQLGQEYFDTTLGKPVWLKTIGTPNTWVDATGATV